MLDIFAAARKLRLEKKVREKQGDTVNVIEIGDSTRGQTECNSNKKISDDEKGSWKNTESSLKDKDSLKNMSIKIISLTIDGKNTKSIIETLAVTEAEANGNIKPEISNNGTNNETDNVTNVTGNELTFEIIVNEDQHSSKHLKERRSIKIFVPLFFKLLSSPTVVFLDLSVSLIFLFQTSIGLFLPKIIQNLFNQSTTTAGLLPGTL